MTDAEHQLWNALRRINLPYKIRRQHPIGQYVVDFAIPARMIAIEIDGGQHADTIEADARRTEALRAFGYRVIRFWNNDVFENMEGVLQTVIAEVEK
jgi:very-short-patch-repair endonuclease